MMTTDYNADQKRMYDDYREKQRQKYAPATQSVCVLTGASHESAEDCHTHRHEIESVNPDPEAQIEQMIHELAYERVKQSYLFNVLDNAAVDMKADELAGQIASLVETWILAEVSQAATTSNEGS
jgi:hypothetical protein